MTTLETDVQSHLRAECYRYYGRVGPEISLRQTLDYINQELDGSSLRLQWVHDVNDTDGRVIRFHVVQDFDEPQPHTAQGLANFLSFRELEFLIRGIEFGLEAKR